MMCDVIMNRPGYEVPPITTVSSYRGFCARFLFSPTSTGSISAHPPHCNRFEFTTTSSVCITVLFKYLDTGATQSTKNVMEIGEYLYVFGGTNAERGTMERYNFHDKTWEMIDVELPHSG